MFVLEKACYRYETELIVTHILNSVKLYGVEYELSD